MGCVCGGYECVRGLPSLLGPHSLKGPFGLIIALSRGNGWWDDIRVPGPALGSWGAFPSSLERESFLVNQTDGFQPLSSSYDPTP